MTSGHLSEAAMAPSTNKHYHLFWKFWEVWCDLEGVTAVPAHPGDVAKYLQERGEIDQRETVRQRKQAIVHFHRINGHTSPADSDAFRLFMRKVYKEMRHREAYVQPIVSDDLTKLRAAAKSPRDKETLALICVMRDGLLRRHEAVSLRREDVEQHPEGNGHMLVRDRMGRLRGHASPIPLTGSTMDQLRQIGATGFAGPVFDFSVRTVNRRIKELCEKAGLRGRFGGRSPRMGKLDDKRAVHRAPNFPAPWIRRQRNKQIRLGVIQ